MSGDSVPCQYDPEPGATGTGGNPARFRAPSLGGSMLRKGLATTAAVALALPVLVALPAVPALAAPAKAPAKEASGASDVRELHRTDWKLDGKTLDTSKMASQKVQSRS